MTARLRRAALASMSVIALAGCAGAGADEPIGAQPSVPPSIYPLAPAPVGTTVVTPDPAGPAVAGFGATPDGVVLPNLEATPGAAYPDVHEAEVCNLHYTQGIRQPRFNTKVEAFARYGISIRDRDSYQLDHLIPISLGGNNETENLWPQPIDDVAGARQKDLVERQLRGLVCSGVIPLADAQRAITVNWWLAYGSYMGLPIFPGTDGLPPPSDEAPAPGEVVNGAPCPEEGAVGYTDPKQIRLTCERTAYGELRWQKRD